MTMLDNVTSCVSTPLVLITIAVGFLAIFVRKFFKKDVGKNPFVKDVRRPPQPLVTDKQARDRVIKHGFAVKKIPDALDAVVIGSGMGGMTTASLLARAGKRVLVLEQHDQAGGCCHTFVEKGYEFDVGIHYIGEMHKSSNALIKFLVEQLTEGQLQWEQLDDAYDMVALGDPAAPRRIPIMSGRREFRNALIKEFPNEVQAIDKYLALLSQVRKSLFWAIAVKFLPIWIVKILEKTGLINWLSSFMKYSRMTVLEVLESLTDDEDLRATLAYNYGDYGTPPSSASFSMHAMLINHFMYGVSYPIGGASEIAFHIIPTIEKNGGKVLVRAPVSRVLMDNGRAVGVTVRKSGEEVEIHAPIVISDAGAYNTFTKLVPQEAASKTSMYTGLKRKDMHGWGFFSLFVGLKGSAKELGLKPQNMWAMKDRNLDRGFKNYVNQSLLEAGENDVPLIFVSFPSTKDPTWPERYPGKSTCTVVTVGRFDWFEKWEKERVQHRGHDYEQAKLAIGERMWAQVCKLFPQLDNKELVEYFDIATPITNNYYIGSDQGEIYGLDHNTERFGSKWFMKLRAETEIDGLYMTGQDVFACGFVGSMTGGVICASKILNRNCYQDLMDLKRETKKLQ